jgi:hypothetical protein
MKFFPYEKYKLISPLKQEDALKKLAAAVTIGPTSLFASSRQDKYYQGKISGYSFEITRIIGYRNSFRPVIIGEISSYLGSEINIVMRMNMAVIIFCCVWMGGVLIAAIATLAAQINSGKFLLPGLIPFAMLLLGYILFTGGFKYESIKAKKFLKELFEAEKAA